MSVNDKHSAANTGNNKNVRNRGKVGLSKNAKPLVQPPWGIKTVNAISKWQLFKEIIL